MKQLSLIAIALLLVFTGAARAEDGQPSSERWMLTLEHGPLRIVEYRTVDRRTIAYHYITLKVTNGTDLPRDWHPLAKALTDTGRTYVAAGWDEALDTIRAKEQNPDLVPIASTRGKIQPGQTLDTVAIFGPLDPEYDRVDVQVIGLADPIAIYKVERYDVEIEVPAGAVYTLVDEGSGEAETLQTGVIIQDVAYVQRNALVRRAMQKAVGEGEIPEPQVQYWEVRERRAYQMTYSRPGDEFRPDDDLIRPVEEGWVAVGDVQLEREIKM
jgi:hypothetical protein